MIEPQVREGGRTSIIGTQGESVYRKDTTTISQIMAAPVRAIEISTATIDFVFIAYLTA